MKYLGYIVVFVLFIFTLTIPSAQAKEDVGRSVRAYGDDGKPIGFFCCLNQTVLVAKSAKQCVKVGGINIEPDDKSQQKCESGKGNPGP